MKRWIKHLTLIQTISYFIPRLFRCVFETESYSHWYTFHRHFFDPLSSFMRSCDIIFRLSVIVCEWNTNSLALKPTVNIATIHEVHCVVGISCECAESRFIPVKFTVINTFIRRILYILKDFTTLVMPLLAGCLIINGFGEVFAIHSKVFCGCVVHHVH